MKFAELMKNENHNTKMTAPTTQATETQVVEQIMQAIDGIDREGLVDLANTLLGTDFVLEDIEWAK
jgi:hypothetical protein